MSAARRRGALLLACLASAALLAGCAFLPPPAHLLVLVALVPWLAALDRARTARGALAAGAALAAAFMLAALGWFADAVARFTGWPRPAAWLALALLAPLLQPQLPLAALARHAARAGGAHPIRGALALALAWTAVESLVPKLLGDTLGLAFAPAPWLRQAADLAGATGLTAGALAVNELLLALARAGLAPGPGGRLRRAALPAGALAALLLAWGGYGAARLRQLAGAPDRPTVTVGVVQSNLVAYDRLARERGRYAVVREVLDVHQGLSQALVERGAVDLLVWPETVYPTTFGAPQSADGAALDQELEAFARREGVPLAFGAYEAGPGAEYVSAFFLQPGVGGLARASYRKAHLFPLTEWAPGPLSGALARRLLPWLGGWTPGPGPQVVPLQVAGRPLRVGPLLCYDAVRPEHAAAEARAGAELLLALSNDAWFDGGPGSRLHLAVARLRAVETRLPLARAAPSGISAVIEPSGEVAAAAAVGERAALAVELTPGRAVDAPFLWLGPWLGPAALLGLAAVLGSSMRPRSGVGAPAKPGEGRQPLGGGQRARPKAAARSAPP
ncbi:MAG: apolipoprotein N-acyltransferase [Anaeromyxobacter sp.]